MAARPYYRGIRGSAAIATAPLTACAAVQRAEALAPGEMRRVPFAGELIGAARVRSHFAPVPLSAFDGLGGLLSAEDQGAYFQLLRLSFGEGRNFCRAGKRDLMDRFGVSERRLNRILDTLVEKGFLRLLQRDNRGTLYRVFLPEEALGAPLGDEVLLGRAEVSRGGSPAPTSERAVSPAPRTHARGSVLALARELAVARGAPPEGAPLERAAAEIADLVAEGHTEARLKACIDAVARRHAHATASEGAAR